jgi:beta-phosphoglucomutase family hydrolase
MYLDIPDRSFSAFVYDCDGTLVDSMPLHYRAWTMALQHHCAPWPFTEDFFYSQAGISEPDTVRRLNHEHGSEVDPEGVARTKMETFFRLLEDLQPVAAVREHALAYRHKVPLAVVSGSEAPLVRECLQRTGMLDWFDAIITPADVRRGKPAPDMFLLAAERLGVDPVQCLVFEDGQSGIDGARAAGMSTVFVPSRGMVRP